MGIFSNLIKPKVKAFFNGVFSVLSSTTNSTGKLTLELLLAIPEAKKSLEKISSNVAQLPLNVWRKTKDGREKATDHPAHKMLTRRPNPYHTPAQFKKISMMHVLSEGNIYWLKLKADGKTVGYQPLNPSDVEVNVKSGVKTYNTPQGMKTDEDILHIFTTSKDGFKGIGIVGNNYQVFELARILEKFSLNYFKNGASPSLAVIFGQDFKSQDEWDRAKEKLQAGFSGEANAGKIMTLGKDSEVKQIGSNINEAQLIEAREFTAKEIRKVFGLVEEKENGDIERESLEYLTFVLEIYLTTIEQALTYDLFGDDESLYVEFNRDAILKTKALERWQIHAIQRQITCVTPNTINEQENLPRVEGGDNILLPLASNVKENGVSQSEKQGVK